MIEVDPETEHWAKVALQRMLDLPGEDVSTGRLGPSARVSWAGGELALAITVQSPGAPRPPSSATISGSIGQVGPDGVADLELEQGVALLGPVGQNG